MLFHIYWEDPEGHYYIDKGAFNHEEEIILDDGTMFQVVSVLDQVYELFELQNVEDDERFGPQYNGAKVVKVMTDEDNGYSYVVLLEGEECYQ